MRVVHAARQRLFARFLSTAREAVFLETTHEKRAFSSFFLDTSRVTEKSRPCTVFRRGTLSSRCVSHWLICYTESRARPLRRRRRRMRLPFFEFVRTRKPCVRARFFFFGWYVLRIDRIVMKKRQKARQCLCILFSTHYPHDVHTKGCRAPTFASVLNSVYWSNLRAYDD